MLGTLVEQLAGEPVDELQQRIVEHAGGNPLFAEQMLALAREAPDLAFDEPPATVEALLASRLDRLDPHELAVLRRRPSSAGSSRVPSSKTFRRGMTSSDGS